MSIRSKVIALMCEIAARQDRILAPLRDDLILMNCGLDSLCFAILIAQLEDEFGFDPFIVSDDVCFPITFAEFVALYDVGAADRLHAA